MKTQKSALSIGIFLLLASLIAPLQSSSASLPATRLAVGVDELIGQQLSTLAMPTSQIIIKYRMPDGARSAISPASADQLQRLSEAARVPLAYVRAMSGDAHVLRLPGRFPLPEVQAIADRLSTQPEVAYAEPDAIMVHTSTPGDPQYG